MSQDSPRRFADVTASNVSSQFQSKGMPTPDIKTMEVRLDSNDRRAPSPSSQAGPSILKSPMKSRAKASVDGKRHLTYHRSVLVWDAAEHEDERELLRLLGEKEVEATSARPRSPYTPEVELDVNMSNHEGVTLLHLCCFTGSVESVRSLLQKGANPNLSDREGWMPMHVAAATSNIDVLRALIAGGAQMPPRNTELGQLGLSTVTTDEQILALCTAHHQRFRSSKKTIRAHLELPSSAEWLRVH